MQNEADEGEAVLVTEDFSVTFDPDLVERQIAEAEAKEEAEGETPSTMAYPVNDYAAVRSITAYPLVRCVETGERRYWTNVYAISRWLTQKVPSASCHVSSEERVRLNELALSKFIAKNDGLTYELCGWYVKTEMEFHSLGTMLYVQWEHSSNSFFKPGVYKENIPIDGLMTIYGSYEYDPDSTEYKYSGWRGGFYRRIPNGTVLGYDIGAGVAVNW